jgi:hypothetical protein
MVSTPVDLSTMTSAASVSSAGVVSLAFPLIYAQLAAHTKASAISPFSPIYTTAAGLAPALGAMVKVGSSFTSVSVSYSSPPSVAVFTSVASPRPIGTRSVRSLLSNPLSSKAIAAVPATTSTHAYVAPADACLVAAAPSALLLDRRCCLTR